MEKELCNMSFNEILYFYCKDPDCFAIRDETEGENNEEVYDDFAEEFNNLVNEHNLSPNDAMDSLRQSTVYPYGHIAERIEDVNNDYVKLYPAEEYFKQFILPTLTAEELYQDWGAPIEDIVEAWVDCENSEYDGGYLIFWDGYVLEYEH